MCAGTTPGYDDATGVLQVTQGRKLSRETEALLSASNEARLEAIGEDYWITYTLAQQTLLRLSGMVTAPDSGRPANMLLIARTNNGKSSILRRFAEKHPPALDASGGVVTRPVVSVEMPPVPGEERLYTSVLESLGAVFKPRDTVDVKRTQVLRLLQGVGCRVLVVDEVNNALSGTPRQQQQVLNAIKHIGNTLKRPVVLSGIETTAAILRQDPQMQNRFPPHELPLWQEGPDLQRLLMSIEGRLPLRQESRLHQKELLTLLLGMSEGMIGELVTVLRRAATMAVVSGDERITPELLNRLDWQSPSQRNARAGAIGMGL